MLLLQNGRVSLLQRKKEKISDESTIDVGDERNKKGDKAMNDNRMSLHDANSSISVEGKGGKIDKISLEEQLKEDKV